MKSLECETDGFRKYFGLKLSDTHNSWFNKNMTLDECGARCLKNCSCTAFAKLNALELSGCLLWFGDLIDMKDLSVNVQGIYLRMASSDSDPTALKLVRSKNKKDVMIRVVLPLVFGSLLLAMSLIVYYWRKKKKKKKRSFVHMEGRQRNISETQRNDMEL